MQVPYSFQSPHFQQQTQSDTVLVAPPAEQPITQEGYTVSAFPLLLSFLLQRHNYSQELYPTLTLLFPLTGKKWTYIFSADLPQLTWCCIKQHCLTSRKWEEGLLQLMNAVTSTSESKSYSARQPYSQVGLCQPRNTEQLVQFCHQFSRANSTLRTVVQLWFRKIQN